MTMVIRRTFPVRISSDSESCGGSSGLPMDLFMEDGDDSNNSKFSYLYGTVYEEKRWMD